MLHFWTAVNHCAGSCIKMEAGLLLLKGFKVIEHQLLFFVYNDVANISVLIQRLKMWVVFNFSFEIYFACLIWSIDAFCVRSITNVKDSDRRLNFCSMLVYRTFGTFCIFSAAPFCSVLAIRPLSAPLAPWHGITLQSKLILSFVSRDFIIFATNQIRDIQLRIHSILYEAGKLVPSVHHSGKQTFVSMLHVCMSFRSRVDCFGIKNV